MITVGASLPSLTLKKVTETNVDSVDTRSYFSGKTTLLFGLPGAFTPVCSGQQVPSYLKNKDALHAKGIHQIACLSVNDSFVMQAWAKDLGTSENIVFLADGSAAFTKALGMEMDLDGFGMGVRCKRFAMIVKNGTVDALYVENSAGECGVSHADQVLAIL